MKIRAEVLSPRLIPLKATEFYKTYDIVLKEYLVIINNLFEGELYMPLHEGNIVIIEDKSSDVCNLTESDIKDEDVSLLCEYLVKNPHKKKVILDRTDIRNATHELSKLPLTKLSLRQTNIHDESIKDLCHSNIEFLDLGRTNLTNQSAAYMIEHARQTRICVDVTGIAKDMVLKINQRTQANKQKSSEELLRATLFGGKHTIVTSPSTPINKSTLNPKVSPNRSNGSPHN